MTGSPHREQRFSIAINMYRTADLTLGFNRLAADKEKRLFDARKKSPGVFIALQPGTSMDQWSWRLLTTRLQGSEMENNQIIIHDLATVEMLRNRGYSELPENIQVETPYRKHVFWLPRHDNAQEHVVRIQARITVVGDCNFGAGCVPGGNILLGELSTTPEGYFQIDKPHSEPRRRLEILLCSAHTKSYDLILRDSLIAYSSSRPIVIHAHESIDIHHTVEARPAVSAN